MPGLGTAINVATIVAGTGLGLLAGGRIPERARTTVLQSVGLVVLVVGAQQALRSGNIVFPLVSVVAGALVGEALRIEERLEALGERIRRRVEKVGPVDAEAEGTIPGGSDGPGDGVRRPTTPDPGLAGLQDAEGTAGGVGRGSTFVEGFVAASLLFCVGPLAVLGSIADGLEGDIGLLAVKAALDGLVSVVFAATLGWGVAFSALPVLVYQGALTLLAGGADAVLSERMVVEGTATGGIMVMGIALRLLDVKQVRVGSLLPGLLVAPVLVALFAR